MQSCGLWVCRPLPTGAKVNPNPAGSKGMLGKGWGRGVGAKLRGAEQPQRSMQQACEKPHHVYSSTVDSIWCLTAPAWQLVSWMLEGTLIQCGHGHAADGLIKHPRPPAALASCNSPSCLQYFHRCHQPQFPHTEASQLLDTCQNASHLVRMQ